MLRFVSSPWFLAIVLFSAVAPSLRAQINVQMDIPRHLYLCYEPIVATVAITNMTGRDLTLEDKAPDKWFSFEILDAQGTPISPRAVDYHLDPITIPVGQTVKRKVNLVNLYPVTDYGVYHIKALVYFDGMDKYFSSAEMPIEVSEGTTLWNQTVGIPDGQQNSGQYRSYELMSFRQPKDNMLYVRIEDHDSGVVYGTYPLGRLVDGYPPEAQVDPPAIFTSSRWPRPRSISTPASDPMAKCSASRITPTSRHALVSIRTRTATSPSAAASR